MTSSMITGERRWASARRGGMTVLGKVAVPKPINLPSQKLENHGLDPNVEIVPKGTLSWGSRPSSASSNAWGTSALSPSTDGGGSSPSHLAGRPLSGGGTRPSTSGSDRAHDSNVSAWGPNSRPSSASGVHGSNQGPVASSRPRSADTRPGSSHLSRFAEPLPEVSGAWGAGASSERMELATSGNKGFSLSSGDFPTLGSEKDESGRNMESPDHASHGRPGSSSGEGKSRIDSTGIRHGDDARESDVKGNSWGNSSPPFVEDGPRPNMERWHGDPRVYHNPNMGPSHYDWPGAPGGWFGGPPGPPPYCGPVPPGGFPVEPFPYYRPQVPGPGIPNSQPTPPGAAHHGHHPNNGDIYRPHMQEPFMNPRAHMRPQFYPGPVPYDPYFRPPMRFCNPNDRDMPFMGMPAGPPVYNRPPNQNAPDLTSSYPGSRDARGPDQGDHGSLHDPRGDYKVLVKPNDSWNQHDEEKWGHRVTTDVRNREKGILSRATMHENAWGADYKNDENVHHGDSAMTQKISSRSLENGRNSGNPANFKFSEKVRNVEERGTGPARDTATSKDLSLIQKIEGLNAKVRSTGGRQDFSQREELTDRVQFMNVKAHQTVNEAKPEVVLERHYPSGIPVQVCRGSDVGTWGKNGEFTVTPVPRRAVLETQNRGSHPGRGKFNVQEDHGWGKKSESHSVPAAGSRSITNDQAEDGNTALQPTDVPKTKVETQSDGESATPGLDSSDIQRARMREIAKQRAIQLQREEEERIREQKAKALAKLEELNRRSAGQGAEVLSEKESVPQKQDNSRDQLEAEASVLSGSSSDSPNNTAQANEKIASKLVDSAVTSGNTVSETKRNAHQDVVTSQSTANVNINDSSNNTSAAQVPEVSKQKRVGYKQRQNYNSEKALSQDPFPDGRKDVLKDHKSPNTNQEVTGGSEVDKGLGKEWSESVVVPDVPAPQKRRNNKSGKSKHKIEDSSTAFSNAVSLSNNSTITPPASGIESNPKDSLINATSAQVLADKERVQSPESHSSLSREDAHGRGNNAWKAQNSRKARNSQGNRLSEKSQSNDAVVWAPVRSHNSNVVADRTSETSAEPITSVAGEVLHNGSRTKRAEMERYVPKPVAKELAQQGSIQHPPCLLVDQVASDGTGGRGSESLAKAGPFVESKLAEGKNRHAKAPGSWRQRSSVEPNTAQASQDSSSCAISTGKNLQTSSGLQQTVRSSESMMKDRQSQPDDLPAKAPVTSVSDGWNSVNANSSSSVYAGVKDQVSSGRGKKHPHKGQKSSVNHQGFDNKESNVGLAVLPCSPESNIPEKTQSPKENRAAGDRSGSHWQPKYVAVNQQGNKSSSGQNKISEDRKDSQRDFVSGVGSHSHSQNSQSTAKDSRPGSVNRVLGEAMPNVGHQDFKREKRGSHAKRQPHSHNQGPAVEMESATLEAVDGRNEQRPSSSGYGKNPNHSGWVDRGHDSRGDWGPTPQEGKQHYSSANRERQRQNSHYEYQPVGPYNNHDSGSQVESQAGGLRGRGRGQNHPRRGRGNFYGRQSANE